MMMPVNILHCYQLLTNLLIEFSASPVQWNTQDYPVPKVWTHRTCMITFDKMIPTAWDVFSELQVAKAIATAMMSCVKEETRWLGGRLAVGARSLFIVSVFGRGGLIH